MKNVFDISPTVKLRPSVKKKWVEALRSGEYMKGTGCLCKQGSKYDRFCCLGVLTDLYLIEKNEGWEDSDRPKELSYNGHGDDLCFEVKQWACKKGYNNSLYAWQVKYRGDIMSFETANDGNSKNNNTNLEVQDAKTGECYLKEVRPLSFEKIADLIEEQL